MSKKIKELQDIANIMRRDVLKMTNAAGNGHPTSCLSCAEIMACLYFNEMKYDFTNPENKNNDEFIFSKGHAAPILYSALFRAGAIKDDLMSLRKIDSNLEGHPIPRSLSWVKVATGSLGQGLSNGIGFAMAARLQGRKYRTYVLMGDSEMAEGSVWEAIQLASYYELNNLTAIIDVNSLGQRGKTMLGWNTKEYKKRLESFGWNTKVVDGHNIKKILKALKKAKSSEKPFAIIAKTVKGKGVSFLENKEGWHGKALNDSELIKALQEIKESPMPLVNIVKPEEINFEFRNEQMMKNDYSIGEEISTREAYGKALGKLCLSSNKNIVIDSEVSNSTYAEEVKKTSEKQFIEAYIAEQNMIGISLGLSKKGFNVYASSFSSFLSRAFDQLRMSSISSGKFTVCGSHCGVSIGEDGASQMGLEDISMFRSLIGSSVFYPTDAVSTQKIVKMCENLGGIKYIRTTRGKTKIIYKNDENFELGEFKVLKESKKDKIVLVGAGITMQECLKANEELKNNKIETAVVDLYCIKPFNSKKFIDFVKKHGNKIIIVEDHYREGGIGEMLLYEIKNSGIELKHLFVKEIPHSGKPQELLEKFGIDSKTIVKTALGWKR